MNKLTWHKLLSKEKNKDYFIKIINSIKNERKLGKIIYPPQKNIFYAFKLTKIENIKVVILGQDPYHQPNQANGLSFSVDYNIKKIPPSLINIFKELSNNFTNFPYPKNGCLINWAQQGVFLLNTILTVEKNKPNSHSKIGWEIFTDTVIKMISDHCKKVVFLLWGIKAKNKIKIINSKKHKILCSAHPSPFSANLGFFGCKHFVKANKILEKWGIKPIDWIIKNKY